MAVIAPIDAWAQPVLAGALERVPEIRRLFEQSGTGALLQVTLDPEAMVQLMDAAGVDRVLLSAWCRPGGWVFSNDDVHEYVRAFPDRFLGAAAVDLEHPMEALKELDRAVNDLGFKALRMIPWLWDRPPNHRLYYPLFARCVELDIPFCTQVGHTGPLRSSETGRPIPYIDQVALDFPELRIVGGHIGYPWADEMISLAWKHANVFIDTSAYLPRYYPKPLLHFLSTYGRDKVLFGSNFPQLDWARCVQGIGELNLPAEIEESFLRDNAKRVFHLD